MFFAVDQSTLSPEAIADRSTGRRSGCNTNTDYLALIEGHADEQGTREYNVALGARRANAVREYLVSRGRPAGAAPDHLLRQGAARRDLLGGDLLRAEPPRRDGDLDRGRVS